MEGEPPKVDFCIRCGEYLRPGVTYCPKCGAPRPGAAPRPSALPSTARSRKVSWAGVLLCLAGIVGFVMAVYVLTSSEEIIAQAEEISGGDLANLEDAVVALAGFWVFAGAMSMVGGVCALKRRYYPLVVIGAVMAVMTGGFFLEGTIMGLIALVLVLTSRQEFR